MRKRGGREERINKQRAYTIWGGTVMLIGGCSRSKGREVSIGN